MGGVAVTRAEVEAIHRLRAVDGLSVAEIEERTGRAQTTVRRMLRTEPCEFVEAVRFPIPAQRIATMRRAELAALRAAMRAGDVTLADLLLGETVHPLVADMPLIDVAMMQRVQYRARNAPGMEAIGRLALRDGVNVLCRAGRASVVSRRWMVENTLWARRRRARLLDVA